MSRIETLNLRFCDKANPAVLAGVPKSAFGIGPEVSSRPADATRIPQIIKLNQCNSLLTQNFCMTKSECWMMPVVPAEMEPLSFLK
jgi:hypothetical protein